MAVNGDVETVAGLVREWSDAFTRIGNALGLKGRFMGEFGYEQIEQRARDDRNHDAIELAWGIIANAQAGDWDAASPEWKAAAERWRDRFVLGKDGVQ